MTDTYGPFAGVGWIEADWADYAPTWAPSGLLGVPATVATSGDLAFSSTGLSVSAGVGKAWIQGAGFKRTGTPTSHAVTANTHASFSRRDRLVLRRDLANHQVVTALLAGTPLASPAAPALTQVAAGVWEMPLFSFLVPPNSGTTITGVVDERPWTDAGGLGLQMLTTGRAPITTTGKVGTTTALTGLITVPPVSIPSRLVFVASGRAGFDDAAQEAAWEFDTITAGATNVDQDDATSANRTYCPPVRWAQLTQTLSFDLAAYAVGTARLILRSTAPVYSRGAVTWHRTPIV